MRTRRPGQALDQAHAELKDADLSPLPLTEAASSSESPSLRPSGADVF